MMRWPLTIRYAFVLACALPWFAAAAHAAEPAEVYRQAIDLAARDHAAEAVAMLQGALAVLPATDIWHDRMAAAEALIAMRRQHAEALPIGGNDAYVQLIRAYLRHEAVPARRSPWIPALLGALLPGSGHLWLGRPHDAWVAAVMVWPMLLLTLWAYRRGMGPVTVFFALVTVWLWSGTVFSAWSLAERGDFESYLAWWQGLWQASALPGRPW
jgi:hypothetical protein